MAFSKSLCTITDSGCDIGDTFRAVRLFARRNQPKIIILENVTSAPWVKDIVPAFSPVEDPAFWGKFKDNDGIKYKSHPGFSVVWKKYDTRNYYLPQSRNRGYMILINRHVFQESPSDKMAAEWVPKMKHLERKTSVSAEAFLLKPDDPRLHKARNQVTRDLGNGRKVTIEWSTSAMRHAMYREKYKLGRGRSLLKWNEQGASEPRDFTWMSWVQRQVQRVKDSIEINTVRNVARWHMDSEYKLRFWNLSQNIDRNMDTMMFGLVECLTPTGIYYNTLRGGPLVGAECLSLQGLPLDELLISRETEREQLDLAGNAMSATVVAAATISGIILLAYRLGIRTAQRAESTPRESTTTVSEEALHTGKIADLEYKPELLQDLHSAAKHSLRLCYCEGQSSITVRPVRGCKDCLFTSCSRCGGNPEHNYGPFGHSIPSPRVDPQEFRAKLRNGLPMRLCVDIDLLSIHDEAAKYESMTKDERQSLKLSLRQAPNGDLRLSSITRSHCWTVTYKAPHSHLDLVITPDSAEWLLYAEPAPKEAGNSPTRQLLSYPVARMRLTNTDIFQGQWELRQPIEGKKRTLQISRSKNSKLIPTWDSTLGLQLAEYSNKRVWDTIDIKSVQLLPGAEFESTITGTFQRLPKCDTAFASLYRRIQGKQAPSKQQEPVFLFFESSRSDLPELDGFVFSRQKHRLEYGEQRDVIAKLDTKWRPTNNSNSNVQFKIPARWRPVSGALTVFEAKEASTYAVVSHDVVPEFSMASNSCATAGTAILSCRVPLSGPLSLGEPTVDENQVGGVRSASWINVHKTKHKTVLSDLSFLFFRSQSLGGFPKFWRSLERGNGPSPQLCYTCAPVEPNLKWELDPSKKKATLRPYEDEEQAADFEKAMQKRPDAFLVQTRMDHNNVGCLRIALNSATLLHRAMGRLTTMSRIASRSPSGNISTEDPDDEAEHNDDAEQTDEENLGTHLNLPHTRKISTGQTDNEENFGSLRLQWRLDTEYLPRRPRLSKFYLMSNRGDRPSGHRFLMIVMHGSRESRCLGPFQLRDDQQRSLRWMMRREDPDAVAYIETETAEAILESLGWRAAGKVDMKRGNSGGVRSDQVGYGKTIIIIALIDATLADAWSFVKSEIHESSYPGKIPLRATLIVLPPTLCRQWGQEFEKFTGSKINVLVIQTPGEWQRLTVGRLRKADVLIVSWQLFGEDTYIDGSARLAAVPAAPTSGGRDFDHWLSKAMENMSTNVDKLVRSAGAGTVAQAARTISERLTNAHKDQDLVRNMPIKRGSGKDYKALSVPFGEREQQRKAVAEVMVEELKKEIEKLHKADAFKLEDASSLDEGTGLPLHAFAFFRVVLDEHSYLHSKPRIGHCVKALTAQRQWILSGTPPLSSFANVRSTFDLIGVPLGIEDDNVESLPTSAIQTLRNSRSSAERFRAFDETYSPDWHEGRDTHAQKTLNLLARQNHLPLVSRIPAEEILVPVVLASMELAYYAEMHQTLIANSMRLVKPVSQGNLDLRNVQERLLVNSVTAEEALVRCASTSPYIGHPVEFDTQSVYQALLKQREGRLALLSIYIFKLMKKAVYLLKRRCPKFNDDGSLNVVLPKPGKQPKQPKQPKQAVELTPAELAAELAKNLKAAKAAETRARNKQVHEMSFWSQFDFDSRHITQGDAEMCKILRSALDLAQTFHRPRVAALFFLPTVPPKKTKKASKFNISKAWISRRGRGLRHPMTDLPSMSRDKFHIDKEYLPRKGVESASALRSVLAVIRKLITRWKVLYRSFRYLQSAHTLQEWMQERWDGMGPNLGKPSKPFVCSNCATCSRDTDNIVLLGVCGHIVCRKCLGPNDSARQCPIYNCLQTAADLNVVSAATLGRIENRHFRYGSKIDAMINTIQGVPNNEQILIFVQYAILGMELELAMENEGIKFYSLLEEGPQAVQAMNTFREHPKYGDPQWRQILVLDSTQESAAGA